MSMTELEAARLVRAALRLLRDAIPDDSVPMACVLGWLEEIESVTPPWEPEPGPSAERRWSGVIPGDKVLAPNGTWYPVTAVARIGEQIRAMLDGKIPTTRRADEVVKVERGDAGRAVDVFAAGGISLELIGAGK